MDVQNTQMNQNIYNFFFQPWNEQFITKETPNHEAVRAIVIIAAIIITGGLALIFFAIQSFIDLSSRNREIEYTNESDFPEPIQSSQESNVSVEMTSSEINLFSDMVNLVTSCIENKTHENIENLEVSNETWGSAEEILINQIKELLGNRQELEMNLNQLKQTSVDFQDLNKLNSFLKKLFTEFNTSNTITISDLEDLYYFDLTGYICNIQALPNKPFHLDICAQYLRYIVDIKGMIPASLTLYPRTRESLAQKINSNLELNHKYCTSFNNISRCLKKCILSDDFTSIENSLKNSNPLLALYDSLNQKTEDQSIHIDWQIIRDHINASNRTDFARVFEYLFYSTEMFRYFHAK
ncbi:MAG: hypothetical protein S4CHLAM20_07700 [Chlamydiia bacterium]|nr:hypothetical protein [Chlamydiia bacterium]